MSSSWTMLENSTGEIKVACSGEIWEKAREKAFKRLAKDVKIPGFRAGSAPVDILKKHVDQKSILIEAAEDVASDLLTDALKEHDLDLVARPELKIDTLSLEKTELTFVCTVKPEVNLKDYKGLKAEKPSSEVDEKDIDSQIERLRNNNAELVIKETGVIEAGNTAVLDFKGFVDDKEFEGGSAENYQLEVGSNSFIPGFENQLLGLKTGDKRDISVSFPKDYQAESLAGKPAIFKIEIKEIKEKVLPEADDNFAKEVNMPDVSSLAELRQAIFANLTKQAEKEAEDKFNDALLKQVLENSTVEIPDVMANEEADYLFQDFIRRLQQQGISEELYYQISGQSKDDVMKQYLIDAVDKVKLRLILEKISSVEEINISDKEIEDEYIRLADVYQMKIDEFKKNVRKENIDYDLKLRKALDLIISTANK